MRGRCPIARCAGLMPCAGKRTRRVSEGAEFGSVEKATRCENTESFEVVSSLYSLPPPYLVHYLLESPTLVVLGNPCLSSPVKICFLCRKSSILRLAHSYPRHAQSDSRPLVLTPFGLLSQSTRRSLSQSNIQ